MKGILSLFSKAGINGFFLCLIGAIVLAYLFPHLGTEESPLHLGDIAEYGVSVIFFLYGLRLSPEKLKAGLANWRLHVLVQLSTFLFFPLIIMAARAIFSEDPSSYLWIGVFYLAALPSTVSSSVVMVSIAGGNIPAAIFNASISSIIGIFITPLWMSSFLHQNQPDFNIGAVVLQLCLEVLLPVILGLLLHRWWGQWAEKKGKWLRQFDQLIILLIVYTSFCESFAKKMFQGHSWTEIAMIAGLMLALFFFMMSLMQLFAMSLGFSREDRITVLFCGSKKSLVQGAVMGKVLFPDPVAMGLILLPLMLYHALQLMAGSAMAKAMGARSQRWEN